MTHILTTLPSPDYELLDSGDGEKLERYGRFVLRRPDPQSLWEKCAPALWREAHGVFTRDDREKREGRWRFAKGVPEKWTIRFGGLQFHIHPSAFKHTGLFPEQQPNWDWMRAAITRALSGQSGASAPAPQLSASVSQPGTPASRPDAPPRREVSVLNLFGYTGGATLACAQAGARVCHVDAAKPSLTVARENAALSGLADRPIRWILDDAKAFVARELRRGHRYDAILLDPPAFGRGPAGDVWQIETDFVPLVAGCLRLLSERPVFFLVNGYASGYSQLAYRHNLQPLTRRTPGHPGQLESGELTLTETQSRRQLPCGIFARWREG